jgi:hypothetical protein
MAMSKPWATPSSSTSPSVVHAVQCAQQIQAQLRAHNSEKEKVEQIHVRIGIHVDALLKTQCDSVWNKTMKTELYWIDGPWSGR